MKKFHIQKLLLVFLVLTANSFDCSLINVNTLHRLILNSILLIIFILSLFYKKNHTFNITLKTIVLFFFFFVFTVFISSLINNSFLISLNSIITYLTYFLFLVLFSELISDGKEIHSDITKIISISVSILLFQFFLNYFKIIPNSWFANGSLLSHKTFITEYLVITFPYVIYFLLFQTDKGWKVIGATLLSGLMVLAILYMRSRMGILLIFLTLGVIFAFLINKRKQNRKIFNKFQFLLALIVFVLLSDTFLSHPKGRENLLETLKNTVDLSQPENTSRLKYWQASMKMFLNNPLFGIGTGNWYDRFILLYPELYDDQKTKITADINPHNVYLQILSEAGLFALLLFLGFLFITLKKIIECLKQNIFFLIVGLSFINLLLCFTVSFTIENIATMSIAMIGIIMLLSMFSQENTYNNAYKIIFRILLFFVIIMVEFYSYKSYESERNYVIAMKEKVKKNYIQVIEQYDNISNFFYPVDANKIPTRFYLGAAFFEVGKFHNALESYLSAYKITPNLPSLKNNIALTKFMLGDTSTAIAILENVCTNFKMYIEPEINLLFFYFTKKDYSRAREIISDIKSKLWDTTAISNYYILKHITTEIEKTDRVNETK